MHWNYRQYCLNKYKSRNNILEYITYRITGYIILYAFSVLLPERYSRFPCGLTPSAPAFCGLLQSAAHPAHRAAHLAIRFSPHAQLYTMEILYHISGFLASLLPHFIPEFHLSYQKVNFIMV